MRKKNIRSTCGNLKCCVCDWFVLWKTFVHVWREFVPPSPPPPPALIAGCYSRKTREAQITQSAATHDIHWRSKPPQMHTTTAPMSRLTAAAHSVTTNRHWLADQIASTRFRQSYYVTVITSGKKFYPWNFVPLIVYLYCHNVIITCTSVRLYCVAHLKMLISTVCKSAVALSKAFDRRSIKNYLLTYFPRFFPYSVSVPLAIPDRHRDPHHRNTCY